MRRGKLITFFVALGLIATFVLAYEVAGTGIAIATSAVVSLSLWMACRSCYVFATDRLSITSFWYVTYLVMIFFPAFVVYYEQEGLYRDIYLLAVESVLLTVPLGWLAANWLWAFRREEIAAFYKAEIVDEPSQRSFFWRCFALLGICLALVAAYVAEVRTIPLLYLIRNPGDTLEVAFLREESFKLLDSKFAYFYYMARSAIYPLLIVVTMGAYLKFRSRKWFWMFLVTGVSGILFAAFSVAKSPVALVILVAGIFYYVYQQGRISHKAVAVVLILIFLFPMAVVAYAARSDSSAGWLVLGAIGYRLFYIPAEGVYYYFEVFPSHIPYLHGRGTDKIAKLFGVNSFDASNAVGGYAYTMGLETVTANAAFISDLNADFGIWGVLLGGLLTGAIMQSIQIFVLRRPKTIATVGVFAFLIAAFWFLNSTSLPVVLASDGAIVALVIGWYFDRPRLGGLAAIRA